MYHYKDSKNMFLIILRIIPMHMAIQVRSIMDLYYSDVFLFLTMKSTIIQKNLLFKFLYKYNIF